MSVMKFNNEHLMNHTTKLRKVEFGDLQPNRKYIIVDVYKTCHYVGIFDEYTTSQWYPTSEFKWHNEPAFKDVIEINPLEMDDNMDYLLGDVKKNESVWTDTLEYEKLKHYDVFYGNYTFYDLEEIIEKGKKARQSMEQRSLDIILKRVVNEEFQWPQPETKIEPTIICCLTNIWK